MIGNDVVDLGDPDAQPGAPHPRFDQRVFTGAERQALARHREPNLLRWSFWAAKEAAFKLARRLDRSVIFSPAAFAVEWDRPWRGRVRHRQRMFLVDVRRSGDALHAIGVLDAASWGLVVAEVTQAPGDDARAAVRALALRLIATTHGWPPEHLSIIRDEHGLPRLHAHGVPQGLGLSLAHHGRFIAVALLGSL